MLLQELARDFHNAARAKYDTMRAALQHFEQTHEHAVSAQCRAFYSALRSLLLDVVKLRDRDVQVRTISSAYKWFTLHAPSTEAAKYVLPR